MSALFDFVVGGSPDGGDYGFVIAPSTAFAVRLRSASVGVSKVLFQVWDVSEFDASQPNFAKNPPRASDGAPEITLDNGAGSTGQAVQAATPSSDVTSTMSGGAHSYIVRCVVNGGKSIGPNGIPVDDPSLVHERMIVSLAGAFRKTVATERTQFHVDGWSEAFNRLVTSPPGGGDVVGPAGGVVDGEVAVYSGTTGKLVRASGLVFLAGVLSGLTGTPTADNHAATKAYVDSVAAGVITGLTDNRIARADGATAVQDAPISALDTGEVRWEGALPVWLSYGGTDVLTFDGSSLTISRDTETVLVATAANTLVRYNAQNALVLGSAAHSFFFEGAEAWRADASVTSLSFGGNGEYVSCASAGLTLNAQTGEVSIKRQDVPVLDTQLLTSGGGGAVRLRAPTTTGAVEFFFNGDPAGGIFPLAGFTRLELEGAAGFSGARYGVTYQPGAAGKDVLIVAGASGLAGAASGIAALQQNFPGSGGTVGSIGLRNRTGDWRVQLDGSENVLVDGATGVTLSVGGIQTVVVDATTFQLRLGFEFSASLSTPSITCEAVADAVGKEMIVAAGGNDSATLQAGDLRLRGGANADASGPEGSVQLENKSGTPVIRVTADGETGFNNATPIAKATINGQRNDPESALANLLSWIDTIGLATNSTTSGLA